METVLRIHYSIKERGVFVEITRSFVPVGHGGFCIERFVWENNPEEQATIVYDCGTESLNKNEKICVLENEFNIEKDGKKPVIDALFISHFHRDHINMLFRLVNVCTVKKIYAPYLKPTDKKILILRLYLDEHIDSNELIEIKEFIEDNKISVTEQGNTPEIILVPADDEDEKNTLESNQFKTSQGMNLAKEILGQSGLYGCFNWCFDFYNLYEKDRVEQFFEEYKEAIGEDILSEEIDYDSIKDDPDMIKKIKKVYESVDGDLNVNSLVMYSGALSINTCEGVDFVVMEERICDGFMCSYCRNEECCTCNAGVIFDKPGCLYLGDYDLKHNMSKIIDRYFRYFPYIGCIQIPHHGSRKSFNEEIILDADIVYVILSGIKKSHGLPDDDVVSRFLSCRADRDKLRIVTEKKKTRIDFKIRVCCFRRRHPWRH